MVDEEIIEMYFERSERAVSETADKYGGWCMKISNEILHDSRDSEEVVNKSYLKLWNTIPPTRPQSLKAYLGRIVRNLSLCCLRNNNAKKRGGSEVQLLTDELAEVLPSSDNFEDNLQQQILKSLFDSFLDGHSADERVIFVRRYWYMNSIPDIARDFHMKESAVKMLLKRTRDKLKAFLEKEGYGNG